MISLKMGKVKMYPRETRRVVAKAAADPLDLKNSVDHAVLTKLGSNEPASVIIGPTKVTKSGVSVGAVHEYGGVNHPKRPFMMPALMNVLRRIPALFKGLKFSVHGGRA